MSDAQQILRAGLGLILFGIPIYIGLFFIPSCIREKDYKKLFGIFFPMVVVGIILMLAVLDGRPIDIGRRP